MFMLSVLAQWKMQCGAGRLLPNIETALLRRLVSGLLINR